VIAVVSDDERAAFCRSLGAEVAIVHGDDALAPALRDATGGQGVDAIYDPVGGSMAEDAVGALARGGRLLAVGFAGGDWPRVDVPNLVFANASVMGVFAGMHSAAELEVIHAELSRLIADGRLRSAVTEVVRFAELPAAVQRLADRRVVGKLVMDPGP
jgi:NADPH2:quinone reductase